MKKILFLALALSGVALYSCKNQAGKTSTASGDRTSFGYEYKILTPGTGTKVINTGDRVAYTMYRYLNDTIQGEPYIAEVELMPGDSVQRQRLPFVDLMYMMKEGDSAQVIQKLDTIQNLPPNLKKTDIIKYVVKIRSVKDAAQVQKDKEAAMAQIAPLQAKLKQTINDFNAKKLQNVVTTASGLKYVIIQKGDGPITKAGEPASVHYIGMTQDGNEFDHSYKRGQVFTFPAGQGQVIPGWDEALTTLPKGTKAVAIIKPELGYGAAGSPPAIPANATLFFYMDIQK